MSELDQEMGIGPLDLSGADLKAFDPIPAGRYAAEVFSAEWKNTRGGDQAKLPAGTPMLTIQFRITDAEYENRRVFGNWPIPAPDYENADKLKGSLVRTLVGLGYDEDDVMSGNFDIDFDDLRGRECEVVVAIGDPHPTTKERSNNVRGVHPLGSGEPVDSRLL